MDDSSDDRPPPIRPARPPGESPPPRPARPADAPRRPASARPPEGGPRRPAPVEDGSDREPAGRGEEPAAAARPRPVREGLPAAERSEPPSEPPPPSRTFADAEGCRWRVEVAGRDRTGRGGDTWAPLLLLSFRPAEGRGGEERVLEKLVVASELDDLSESRLVELLADARPAGFEPNELFPGTRRGRGGS